MKYNFGWRRDLPDPRDRMWMAPKSLVEALPASVDLRPFMPPIWDQGNLGSCTANTTAAQCWHIDKTDPFEPSRLFIYYNTRVIEGTVSWDSGASIRNSIKAVVKHGFAPESTWPYDISKFKKKPAKEVYAAARHERVTNYGRVVQKETQIKACLASGCTVNFGASIFESIEAGSTKETGMVPMPQKNETILGGHAMLIVGYDDAIKHYIVRNSWGESYGSKGYLFFPYDYIHNKDLTADLWTIRAVP